MKRIFTFLFLSVFINVYAQGDLNITLYSTSLFFDSAPGDTVTLISSYGWTGNTDATNVVITCEIPSELQVINTSKEPTSQTSSLLKWDLGTLTAGEDGIFFIICVINPGITIGSTVSSTIRISGDIVDEDPGNNSATVEINISDPVPDLRLWVWGSFEEMDFLSFGAEQNVPFTFDIYYFNFTNFSAPNTIIYDTIPENTQFVSAVPEPTTVNGSILSWDMGTISKHGFGQIKVTILPSELGTFENITFVVTDQDKDLTNNRSSLIFNVKAVLQPKILSPAVRSSDEDDPIIIGCSTKFKGLARAGAKVTLYEGSAEGCWGDLQSCGVNEVGSTTAGADRKWEIPLSNLSESGLHYLYIQAEFNGEKSAPFFNIWEPMVIKVDTMIDAMGFDFDNFIISSGGADIIPGALGGTSGTTPDTEFKINKRQNAIIGIGDNSEYLEKHSMKLIINEAGNTYEEMLPVSEVIQVDGGSAVSGLNTEDYVTAHDFIYVHKGFGPGSTIEVWCLPMYYPEDGSPPISGLVWVKCHEILIDPAGYVYDVDIAGYEHEWPEVPPEESFIKNAEVTTMMRTGDAAWERWPAEETGQVNPQVTDSLTNDGIKIPGYFAFYVPSGQYQVKASAPNYADYVSPILTVIDEPVFHNVGMQRISNTTGFWEIPKENPVTPALYTLYQNYPNPFNAGTIIKYYLPKESVVSLKIFDINGRQIATLLEDEWKSEGMHTLQFDPIGMASGVYFYQLSSGGYTLSKKFILLK